MKKRISLSLILVVVMFVACAFAGCGFSALKTMPNTNDLVTGNGGLAVQKGEYLYYVDSSINYSELTSSDNKYNEVKNSAIYRTKVDAQGNFIYDEAGQMQNVELVVPKIAGFERTNLYIYDDYIYFASPNNQKDKEDKLRTDLVDIYRAKLDGSDFKLVYTFKEFGDKASWSVIKNGDKVYVLCFDGTKIDKIECGKNIGKSVNLIDSATMAILPKQDTYEYAENVALSTFNSNIYFTREALASDGYTTLSNAGNIVGKINFASGEKVEFNNPSKATYDLQATIDNYVSYYKTISGTKLFYVGNFVDSEVQVTFTSSYTNVFTLDSKFYGVSKVVVIDEDSNKVLVGSDGNKNLTNEYLTNDSFEIIDTKENYLYYINSNNVFRFNITTKTSEQLTDNTNEVLSSKDLFDIDGNYIYYYETYKGDGEESAKYLTRINLSEKLDGKTGYKVEVVGNLLAEHKSTTNDEE